MIDRVQSRVSHRDKKERKLQVRQEQGRYLEVKRTERSQKAEEFAIGDPVTNGKFYGKVARTDSKTGCLIVVINRIGREESWSPEFTQKVLK